MSVRMQSFSTVTVVVCVVLHGAASASRGSRSLAASEAAVDADEIGAADTAADEDDEGGGGELLPVYKWQWSGFAGVGYEYGSGPVYELKHHLSARCNRKNSSCKYARPDKHR